MIILIKICGGYAMAYPDDKYDQGADGWGDHYYRDSQGREYNENNQETLWSRNNQARIAGEEAQRQQAISAQMEAERYARQQRELQMWKDAWNRTGGIQIGLGSGRSVGGIRSLFPPLNSLESFLIKAAAVFMIGYVAVYTVYYTVIDPAVKAVNRGVSRIKQFFTSVGIAIGNFFRFLWNHFTRIFTVWWDRIRFIHWRPEGIGGFTEFVMDIVSVAMIVFTVIWLVDYYLKRKNHERIPYIMPKDIWIPAASLLGLSVIWWAVIRKYYVWSFFDAVYDTFCMSLWVVAIEWIINRYMQKHGR